jgi:hypothetical protein
MESQTLCVSSLQCFGERVIPVEHALRCPQQSACGHPHRATPTPSYIDSLILGTRHTQSNDPVLLAVTDVASSRLCITVCLGDMSKDNMVRHFGWYLWW